MVRLATLGMLCLLSLIAACGGHSDPPAANSVIIIDPAAEKLHSQMKAIEPFFKPMKAPGRDDWLSTFKEAGQTFDEYIAGNPTLPTAERNVIYVQPLGKLKAKQQAAVKIASDYIAAFYGLPVRSLEPRSIPQKLIEPDQRMIDHPRHRQIRTGYILDKILQPALPDDAAALIAFTAEDLYPDSSMYFVFGQASLENRVGVWSLFRLDDTGTHQDFLLRTMKISVHEVGHMFSMRHCTKYECVMSGTNHLGETDGRPIDACPECMAKIAWMRKQEPRTRYERLAAFARKNKLNEAAADFDEKKRALN